MIEIITTLYGNLTTVVSSGVVRLLLWNSDPQYAKKLQSVVSDTVPDNSESDRELIEWLKQSINNYLDGKINLQGEIPFFQNLSKRSLQILSEISKIPYGETRTYGQIAGLITPGSSARAVGRVCAANKLVLLVPCHRVVCADSAGHYSGGDEIKSSLLKLEISNGILKK